MSAPVIDPWVVAGEALGRPLGPPNVIQFPTDLSYGAIGGSGWSTQVVTTAGGDEYRVARWGRSRGRWVVGQRIRSASERTSLSALHRYCQGLNLPLLFQDWTDYLVESGQGALVRMSTGVYLAKTYTSTDVFGTPFTVTRPITHPVFQSVSFSPAGPAVDYGTGLVSGGTVGTTTWTGQFNCLVRFDDDTPELTEAIPGAGGWTGITLIEVREDL